MGHMLAGENLGLIFMRQVAQGDSYTHFGASRMPVDNRAFYSNKGIMSFAPLYLYSSVGKSDGSMFHKWPEGKDGRRPNLDPDFVEATVRATELTFVSDGRGDLKNQFGPEDVLAYIYAVFHSPEYRRRFEPMLKLDFPRVPPPGAAKPFVALLKLGHELLSLHLLESPGLDRAITRFKGQAKPEVEKVSYAESTVWLDKAQTCGFVGVPEEVWNFHLGGYQVCEKWLKDRKGRTLSKDDIAHYQKIVVAISETIRLMKQIDEVIDQHEGWPGAFVTDPQRLAALKGGVACPKA
jgi:predicted helicase